MFDIRRTAETGSTNDDALALMARGDCGAVAVVADFQRAGRGRRARAWIAPPGSSLLVTAVLPEPVRADALWAVPFWTGLCVADAIEAAAGLRAALQWPNDLLLAGRKCSGILCVSRVTGDGARVGCGTGINVARPPRDPELERVEPPPAFLSDAAPHVTRDGALAALLAAYERRLPELASPEGVARAWEARAGLDGTPYRLLVDGEPAAFDALARRIGDGGALIVEAGGRERRIDLADARVLRG